MAQHMRLKHPDVDYNPMTWNIEPKELKEEEKKVKVKNEENGKKNKKKG
jgi:hypothetical protein